MKRSEMISILVDAINDISGDCDFYISNVGAEKVLSKIEKAGMQPPLLEQQSFKMLHDGQMTYNVHEWEEE